MLFLDTVAIKSLKTMPEIFKFLPNYQIITVQGSSKAHALFLVFFLIYSFLTFALLLIIHLLKSLGSSLFLFIFSDGRCSTGIWTRAAFPTMIACLVGAFTSVPFFPLCFHTMLLFPWIASLSFIFGQLLEHF